MNGRLTTNIFSHSGAGAPVNRSILRLLNHWVHNSNSNFGKLDTTWLLSNGVNITNF